MSSGLILYGPPASGKDTVTHALADLDPTISLFRRLKAGPGRTGTYRMTTEPEIASLRAAGDVIWEKTAAMSCLRHRPPRPDRCARHRHARGAPRQVPAIDALTKATPDTRWTVVYLWCPRDVAEARIVARATGDTSARLRAWEETEPLPSPISSSTPPRLRRPTRPA